MRILLLGGNGFIGKNLAFKLCKNSEVMIYDKYVDKVYFEEIGVSLNNITTGDIKNFEEFLENINKEIDVIVHLVSTISPASSMKEEKLGYEVDLLETLEIIKKAKEKNIKIIFFSSGGTVYGNKEQKNKISENDVPEPMNHYGIIKQTIENILLMYNKVYDTKNIILRVSNPYGYNQMSNLNVGIIPIFTEKILKNQKISVYGNGEIIRDYIFIDDLVEIFEKILFKESPHYSLYNIGTGIGHTINEILEILSIKIGANPTIEYLKDRKIDVHKNILDIKRIEDEFGFKPKYSIEMGIEKYLEK